MTTIPALPIEVFKQPYRVPQGVGEDLWGTQRHTEICCRSRSLTWLGPPLHCLLYYCFLPASPCPEGLNQLDMWKPATSLKSSLARLASVWAISIPNPHHPKWSGSSACPTTPIHLLFLFLAVADRCDQLMRGLARKLAKAIFLVPCISWAQMLAAI